MTPREALEQIRKLIDELSGPMQRGDYIEFMEELASEMECRMDCIRDEERQADNDQ